MSPLELVHRTREQVLRRQGRLLGGWQRFSLGTGALPTIPIDEKRFQQLARNFGSDWGDVWAMASQGRWRFLGQRWPDTSRPLSDVWHLDPVSGTSWPGDSYCFDIDFRGAARGDVKYVWEINRLQFLPPIAAFARCTDNTEAWQWCINCMESWVDANPPFQGINWASGIELAIRLVNLIFCISLLGESTVPKPLNKKLRALFNAHAYWIARYPSLYSSANNHLIAESAALYILASTFPELPNAALHKRSSFGTLIREAEIQIHPDGVGAEQSPTYTAFTLEWYFLALETAALFGDVFPSAVKNRLEDAVEFLSWLTDRAGNCPRIGDDDEGCVLRSGAQHDRHYVCSVAADIAGSLGISCPQPPRASMRTLFIDKPARTDTPPKNGWRTFQSGGYSVLRQDLAGHDLMLVFDHGPLGYLSIAAHGHADALAMWLHIDGKPVLIDSGTFLYHSGGAARSYFRGTRAHNTLTLNDEDQSQISGPFIWSRHARACCIGNRERGVTARHDGYLKRFGVLHERRVTNYPGGLMISDRLIGTLSQRPVLAKIRYILAPEIKAVKTAWNRVELERDGCPIAVLEVSFHRDGCACKAELVAIDVSPGFGIKRKTAALEISLPADALTLAPIEMSIGMTDGQCQASFAWDAAALPA